MALFYFFLSYSSSLSPRNAETVGNLGKCVCQVVGIGYVYSFVMRVEALLGAEMFCFGDGSVAKKAKNTLIFFICSMCRRALGIE